MIQRSQDTYVQPFLQERHMEQVQQHVVIRKSLRASSLEEIESEDFRASEGNMQ